MKFSLFYQSKVPVGGFVSYTSHLCRSLRLMGHECEVYKVRARTEGKPRPFSDGVNYTNISIADAKAVIRKSDHSIITATFFRGYEDIICDLIEEGAEVVLHDHTDIRQDFADFLYEYEVRPIVIRQANLAAVREFDLEPLYVPHPYVPASNISKNGKRPVHAVSVCRMDYDKHTDWLIATNEKLPPERQIQFWGRHTRMYMFQKIVGKYKGWDDAKNYTGPNYPKEHHNFPRESGFAVRLNSEAHFSCDMSAIKGDGGGTQYSFLEAIDGGAVLVINRAWLHPNKAFNEFEHMINCVMVNDKDDLHEVLSQCTRDDFQPELKQATKVLLEHSPESVVHTLITTLDEMRQ